MAVSLLNCWFSKAYDGGGKTARVTVTMLSVAGY